MHQMSDYIVLLYGQNAANISHEIRCSVGVLLNLGSGWNCFLLKSIHIPKQEFSFTKMN